MNPSHRTLCVLAMIQALVQEKPEGWKAKRRFLLDTLWAWEHPPVPHLGGNEHTGRHNLPVHVRPI